ncbi:MAG TPA: TIGR03435 family protein [Bryobacteraceae bacterium]|nr:TIGR03435 family protein [Bryobacteraceae bacterium]
MLPSRLYRGLLAIAAAAGVAQVRTPVEFEVATVKPHRVGDRIVTINVGPGGRFAANGYTLVLLIQRAYGVMGWNVTGGPGWIREDRFDVNATANVEGHLTEGQLQPMLSKLLANRFKLIIHQSSTVMSGFALEVDKKGAKVTRAPDGEERQDTFRMTETGLTGQSIAMPTFARFVAGKLGLVAVDETGLSGLYDFNAHWTIDPDPSASDLLINDPREAMRSAVFAALRDQLGLRLTPKKIPVPMLVIDHAEKPLASDN